MKMKGVGLKDWIKAIKKGSREAELEVEMGWKCKHKVHKSNKTYSRKLKHKGYDNTNSFYS